MPIRQAEPNVFPEDLLTSALDAASASDWWVLHTKPRQEKSVARALWSQEIPFYLPLTTSSNLIRGRRVDSYVPLFASYVFMRGDDESRCAALKTNRLVSLLGVEDGEQLRGDLDQIERLIAARRPLTVEQRVGPGRRVRIKSGMLKGLEGVVVERRNRRRLVVAVHFLQQGASFELEDWQIELLD